MLIPQELQLSRFGNYEHEDMDHDMPTHVIIDK